MLDTYTSIYTAPKSYHCTYWITNTKLQKHYIGVHTSKIPPIHDIGIKYFSSASDKEFKKDQKSNPQDYEYKITGVFPSREEALLNEIELHEAYGVGKNPRFYNLCKATSTGFNRSGTTHKEESKAKISESLKNQSDENRKKRSDSAKNKPPISEEHKANLSIGLKNAWTEERKANMSAAQLGKKRGKYKPKS